MQKINIKNATRAQVDDLLEKLAGSITTASYHLKQFTSIRDSIKDYLKEMNQSRVFWQMLLNAHLQLTIHTLCRIYDQKNLGLLQLLTIIRYHIKSHDDCNTDTYNSIDKDILTVCSKSNLTVKKLHIHRNNHYAHLTLAEIQEDIKLFSSHPLTISDIEKLTATALTIINRYSRSLNSTISSATIPGDDDYKYVLDSVKMRLSLSRSKLREEYSKHGLSLDE